MEPVRVEKLCTVSKMIDSVPLNNIQARKKKNGSDVLKKGLWQKVCETTFHLLLSPLHPGTECNRYIV